MVFTYQGQQMLDRVLVKNVSNRLLAQNISNKSIKFTLFVEKVSGV
jgi:hypothetical protein